MCAGGLHACGLGRYAWHADKNMQAHTQHHIYAYKTHIHTNTHNIHTYKHTKTQPPAQPWSAGPPSSTIAPPTNPHQQAPQASAARFSDSEPQPSSGGLYSWFFGGNSAANQGEGSPAEGGTSSAVQHNPSIPGRGAPALPQGAPPQGSGPQGPPPYGMHIVPPGRAAPTPLGAMPRPPPGHPQAAPAHPPGYAPAMPPRAPHLPPTAPPASLAAKAGPPVGHTGTPQMPAGQPPHLPSGYPVNVPLPPQQGSVHMPPGLRGSMQQGGPPMPPLPPAAGDGQQNQQSERVASEEPPRLPFIAP
jgi:hypothetical protein